MPAFSAQVTRITIEWFDMLVGRLQLPPQPVRYGHGKITVCFVRMLKRQPSHVACRLLHTVGVQSVVLRQATPMVGRQLAGSPGAAYFHRRPTVHVRPVRSGEHAVHRRDGDAVTREHDRIVLGMGVGIADGCVQRKTAHPPMHARSPSCVHSAVHAFGGQIRGRDVQCGKDLHDRADGRITVFEQETDGSMRRRPRSRSSSVSGGRWYSRFDMTPPLEDHDMRPVGGPHIGLLMESPRII